MTKPGLLRTPKAAEYLGISAGALRRLKMLGRGPTPAEDPGRGGVTMYAIADLDKFKQRSDQ
jgi:hypothetical protein